MTVYFISSSIADISRRCLESFRRLMMTFIIMVMININIAEIRMIVANRRMSTFNNFSKNPGITLNDIKKAN